MQVERREFLKFSTNHHATAAQSALSETYWLHVSRRVMACRFEVTLPAWDRTGVRAARIALDESEKLEQKLTIFKENSEVSYINSNGASFPVRVEAALFTLLLLCLELNRETNGAFDITSGPLSRCWGFLKREGRIPEPAQLEKAVSVVGSDKLLLDRSSGTVLFKRYGVEINFGSIGKGYALDRISAMIRNRVQIALLSAGSSSISAIGSGDICHNGWMVGVRHPRDKNRRLAVLKIRDSALSTSGNDEQYFEHQGKRYGHIIDPRSGQPAEGVSGVTVVAQSAAVADALATAFYIGGPDLAQRYCSTHSEILVIMLESESERPIVFGSNRRCELEIISE